MKKKLAAVILAVFLLTTTACSAGGVMAAGVEGTAEKEPAVKQALYPAYVRSGNIEDTIGSNSVESANKWGFIDGTGKFVIQPEYENVSPFFDNGLAVVTKNSRQGLIDKSGKTVLEPEYLYISDYEEGFAIASLKGMSCAVDEAGEVVFKTPYSMQDFHDGLAVISKIEENGETRYGYIDNAGQVVVKPELKAASGFVNGKAVVQNGANRYQIIDKSGASVKTLDYDYVGVLSDGLIVYQDKESGKYGYLNDSGDIAVPAAFYSASVYRDGFAVVRTEEDYSRNSMGAINAKGDFAVNPRYADLYYIGDGLFAAADSFIPSGYFAKKAVIDKNGKQLTDYKYYEINIDKDGLIFVNDSEAAYFVNDRFERVESLPVITGRGMMRLQGDVVRVDMDDELEYMARDGKIIWQNDRTFAMDNGLMLETKKYKPDRCMLIHYPELGGHSDKGVEDSINNILRQAFVGNDPVSEKDENGEFMQDTDIGFYAGQNKDLLIVKETGYIYPIGAAHGMPSQRYYHIDLSSGRFYVMKDLFKPGSGYLKRLSDIVGRQIAEQNLQEGTIYFDGAYSGVREDQGFTVTKDGLQLYFEPYEIAAYAAGFPTFDIPYGQIVDLIDTESAFWKAFDKVVDENNTWPPAKNEQAGTEKLIDLIQDTVSAYQLGLVGAINNNDFSKVAPYLVKDGSLYKEQQTLIWNLYAKGIKEKALGCKVVNIEYNDAANEYYAYVEEQAEVTYAGGSVKIVTGRYKYTAYYNPESGMCLLDKIQKWE